MYSYDKSSKATSEAVNQLAVVKDPFSTATTNPKVPDGKLSLSTGLKLQNRKEVVFGSSDQIGCVFAPGVNNNVTWYGTNNATVQDPSGATVSWVVQPYQDHIAWQTVADVSNSGFFSEVSQFANPAVTWRTVSTGLKIQLTNNSDQNDGWWEAVRIPTSTDAERYCLVESDATAQDADNIKQGVIAGNNNWLPDLNNESWVENPTYTSGRLRDLDKHIFCLKCVNNSRNPVNIKGDINFTDAVLQKSSIGQIQYGAELSPGANIVIDNANSSNLTMSNLDTAFDTILIRFHGRPTSVEPNTPKTPTRLLAHVVNNIEVVYAENSFLQRMHTRSVLAPGIVQMMNMHATNQNNAGQPDRGHQGRGGPVRRRGMGVRRLTSYRAAMVKGRSRMGMTYRRTAMGPTRYTRTTNPYRRKRTTTARRKPYMRTMRYKRRKPYLTKKSANRRYY